MTQCCLRSLQYFLTSIQEHRKVHLRALYLSYAVPYVINYSWISHQNKQVYTHLRNCYFMKQKYIEIVYLIPLSFYFTYVIISLINAHSKKQNIFNFFENRVLHMCIYSIYSYMHTTNIHGPQRNKKNLNQIQICIRLIDKIIYFNHKRFFIIIYYKLENKSFILGK